jgi:hypothetical protein
MFRKIALVTLYLVGLAVVLPKNAIVAQGTSNDTIIFTVSLKDLNESKVDRTLMTPHYLGEDIAVKVQLLKDTYTSVEKASATSPVDKTIVRKPTIYNTVLKLNRLYKTEIKKGLITEDEARANLIKVLDISNVVSYQNTTKLEDALKETETSADIVAVFNRVKLTK